MPKLNINKKKSKFESLFENLNLLGQFNKEKTNQA
jgi:hypothetical protein